MEDMIVVDDDFGFATTLESLSAKATLFLADTSLVDMEAAVVVDVTRALLASDLPRRLGPGATILFLLVSASLSSLDDASLDDASLDDRSSRPRFMLTLELSELVMASLTVLCFFDACGVVAADCG